MTKKHAMNNVRWPLINKWEPKHTWEGGKTMAERRWRKRLSRVTEWSFGLCVKTSKEENECYLLKKTNIFLNYSIFFFWVCVDGYEGEEIFKFLDLCWWYEGDADRVGPSWVCSFEEGYLGLCCYVLLNWFFFSQ